MIQQQARIKLIIDTDPGADDVVALLMALASPEAFEVLGITTVAGNVQVGKTSRNARLAREWAGRQEVPVFAGAARPLLRTPVYADDVHGAEGLPLDVYEPAQGLTPQGAVDFLVDQLRAAEPGSITLAMLGPQTNLALALSQAPEVARGLRQVVVMGGAHFNGGNITPTAEFNLFADPHAAKAVLDAGLPLVYVPLDVTHKVLTSDHWLSRISGLGNRAGRIVRQILDGYVKFDMEHYGLPGGPVHDAAVIAYLLAPQLFKGRDLYLQIDERTGPGFGQSIADWYGVLGETPNVHWLSDANPDGFFELLVERLSRLA